MNMQSAQHEIQLLLPDSLYRWLVQAAEQRAQAIPEVIQTALEYYQKQFNVLQTQTWELCGAFTVAEPESAYQVDETVTNYAEHVDTVVYGTSK